MFIRLLILSLWTLVGCGPRLELIYLQDPPPGGEVSAATAVPPSPATPPQARTPVLSGDVCLQTCTRIAWMDQQAPNPSWIQTCAERCREHSSDGQLACYERVERLEDLEACAIR